jgi:hypothetical protein
VASQRQSAEPKSGCGLSPSDKAMCERRLAQVEELRARPAYFSFYENEAIRKAEHKLRSLLFPDDPKEVDAEAGALVDLHQRSLEEAVRSMERVRDPVDEAVSEALG